MGKEAPVALLHSYLADREDNQKPDRLTRTGILAAAELYRHGEISKICITVEHQLSSKQVERLKILLGEMPQEDLVVKAETVTTRDEIATFKQLAQENGWDSLITIGNDAHLPRIKREIKRGFGDFSIEIQAKSAKEILEGRSRYFSITNEMKDWPEQKSLAFQEKILNTPIIGSVLLKVAPYLSHLKVVLQSWGFKQLERQ